MKKKRSLRARRSSFLSITSVPDLPAVTAPSADHGPSTATAAVLTSKELNLLVFRYLSESGFTHAAFNLGYEAGIDKTDIDGSLIPPNALVTIVQKGLQYIELEADPECGDTDDHQDLSLLSPWDLITKSFSELQIIIKEKKEKLQTGSDVVKEMREKDKELLEREKAEKAEKDKDGEPKVQENKDNARIPVVEGKSKGTGIADGPEPMDITYNSQSRASIPLSEVTILKGHGSEVFTCAWSPRGSLLASGSGDSTARIWAIPDCPCGSNVLPSRMLVLKHFNGIKCDKSKDVTTLGWNVEGTLLATGSYDGRARIWSNDGKLKNILAKHEGPIFTLKWNKNCGFLLSGSLDRTAIVWNTSTWDCSQQFDFHSAGTVDADWRNNVSFATCSTDNKVYVCRVGKREPVKVFVGHQDEVNAVRWDPSGSLLASCSDDRTTKIWSLSQDKSLHDFRDHQQEVYTIRWSPTGLGTDNPNQQPILASASFDTTIKLWDVGSGSLLYTLSRHRGAVYSLAFSPNGQFLASGSEDKYLHIWSLKEMKLIKTFNGDGSIFDICWNKEGDRIAACFSNNLCIIDFRM